MMGFVISHAATQDPYRRGSAVHEDANHVRHPKGELTVEDYFHDVQSWSAAVEAAGLSGLSIEDLSAPPGWDPGFWDPYIRSDHPAGGSRAAVIRARKPER